MFKAKELEPGGGFSFSALTFEVFDQDVFIHFIDLQLTDSWKEEKNCKLLDEGHAHSV